MSFPAYRSYRESGVSWLGQLPSHWGVKALKHLVSTPITDGPHETPEFLDDGVPFVSAEAVSSGKLNFSKIRGYISREDHERYAQKYLPKRNDIYMVKSGATTGVTAIVETDLEFNIWSPLAAIRCGSESHPRFVLHFLRSRNFLEGVTLNWSFGTQQNIGMQVLEKLACACPPLPEQTAIAAFLDRETAKIDALVEEQRRLIELLKEKRQAAISHAVTKGLDPTVPMKDSGVEWLGDVPAHWEIRPLKTLVGFRSGGTPSKDRPEFWDGDVPWASAKDLKVDLLTDTIDHVTQAALEQGAAALIPVGSVVVLVRGMMLARTFPVCAVGAPMTINQDLKALLPGREVDGSYLAWLLRGTSAETLNRLDEAGHGTKALRMEAWTSILLPVPLVMEQELIARHVAEATMAIDALCDEASAAIALFQERRTALISAAVTGKIDVREVATRQAEAA